MEGGHDGIRDFDGRSSNSSSRADHAAPTDIL